MSLLNDALRAAEERQNKPQVSAVYTGQAAPPAGGGSKAASIAIVLLLLVLIAMAAAWWVFVGNKESEVLLQTPVVQPAVSQPAVAVEPEPEPQVAPESVPAPVVAPVQAPPVVPTVAAAEPAVQKAPAPKPEPAVATPPASTKTQVAESKPAPKAETPAAAEDAPIATAQVKQQRETPQAIDLRTRRELERLLARGRNSEAEALLAQVTTTQAAANSREAFAREMLVQGMAARALEWLPEPLANEHADLRLLRARAILEQGNLDLAVATLALRVPPVADAVEYRVTLATLLQQAGEAEESAGHWSELIAYNDSQGAWWLGLAIALETGGRNRSAMQAYAQAAALPGLSPSLADYARQRLNALQAGS